VKPIAAETTASKAITVKGSAKAMATKTTSMEAAAVETGAAKATPTMKATAVETATAVATTTAATASKRHGTQRQGCDTNYQSN
jgi:hypothetical protein